ncbi:hypothetical protein MKUB_52690 [Mycobacterium kubicae]|uniref:HTH cro/C1-type domain-containing protein n=1 Tax=Mycobacterium kubicae TaxID=120959 RepID=A0ABQ1BVM0_9MYCO|nr:hypothetical protein MKUB_00460 [Mycobacterium kubicae]GFG64944.1 hypothetical protein MKUB_24340 [Mycobacterium kubicae]GFG67779.1 hypothetical protein MKUB_52690 [Mycobacterium kubicae]
MEDWAEIRRLYRSEKLSQAAIARRLGLSRNTVAKALRSEAPPRYERKPAVMSGWAQVEMAVRVLLGQFPTMPTTVIAQRVGWTGGHSWFAENVARIRPEYTRSIRAIGWCICPVSRCSAICGFLASWFPITLGYCGRFRCW